MTTVAWHQSHGLAADTQINGDFKAFVHKLYRLKGGHIVGICGDIGTAMRFMDWFAAGHDPTNEPSFPTDEDFEAIVVAPNGKATWWSPSLRGLPICEPFYALGTGAQAAMVAMYLGKTPAQAVRLAMKYDANTGMGVETMVPTRKGKR